MAREYYRLHKSDYIRRAKSRTAKLRAEVAGFKSFPCSDCHGEFPSWAMDFDHLHSKDEALSSMLSRRKPIEAIKDEIKKCDLVCVLCHRLRTLNRGHVGSRKKHLDSINKPCPCPIHGMDRDPKCRSCKNARRLQDYYARRAIDNRRGTENGRIRRKALARRLKGKPCVDCGRRLEPVQMDFDHVRGEKTGHMNRLMADNPSRLEEEIKKCDLVCAVCHRYRTRARKGKNTSEDDSFMEVWRPIEVLMPPAM